MTLRSISQKVRGELERALRGSKVRSRRRRRTARYWRRRSVGCGVRPEASAAPGPAATSHFGSPDEVAHAKPNREFRTGRVGVGIERPSSISYVPCWYYVLRTSSQLGTYR